ncbi:MAG: hypothetical protein AB7D51_03005 [Desulfovibrionaceae bacterium]
MLACPGPAWAHSGGGGDDGGGGGGEGGVFGADGDAPAEPFDGLLTPPDFGPPQDFPLDPGLIDVTSVAPQEVVVISERMTPDEYQAMIDGVMVTGYIGGFVTLFTFTGPVEVLALIAGKQIIQTAQVGAIIQRNMASFGQQKGGEGQP